MKAYRNVGGNVVEIQVDVSPSGEPLLPPNTTVNERPNPTPGHRLTVIGNQWVQVPVVADVVTFDTRKANKLQRLSEYKEWYLKQPFTYDGTSFDGDYVARERLTQAIVMNGATGYTPPVWVTADNTNYTIDTIDDIKQIAAGAMNAFSTRFYECGTMRANISAATNQAELDAVVIPMFESVGVQMPFPMP